MLTAARKGSVPPHLVFIVYGVDYQGIYHRRGVGPVEHGQIPVLRGIACLLYTSLIAFQRFQLWILSQVQFLDRIVSAFQHFQVGERLNAF